MEEINIVHLFGIRIDEPVVTLTDLLVSALCFLFFVKIHQAGKTHKVFTLFKLYFLLMGIATAFGGLFGHAFLYALSFPWKLPGWIVSMFSIMLIERAAINHTRILLKPGTVKVLAVINIIELLVFMSLAIGKLDFFYVEFHSGYGLMFVVLSLEGLLYVKTKNAASKNILIGIAFAALAALVFMNKLSPHQWFNHLALSHTLMAVASYFIYRGVMKIEMHPEPVEDKKFV